MKISKAEFTRRRKKLMAMMDRHSIAIIPGAREVTRSRDTEYPFRQNSDLFYLTGFEEPDSVLVLVPGRRQGQVVLFCRERDPEMELWNGYRLGPEGAAAYLGVDVGAEDLVQDRRCVAVLSIGLQHPHERLDAVLPLDDLDHHGREVVRVDHLLGIGGTDEGEVQLG